MPHRRPVKHGSFGGHFDELVKHFTHSRPRNAPAGKARKSKPKAKTAATLNQKLFERAIH